VISLQAAAFVLAGCMAGNCTHALMSEQPQHLLMLDEDLSRLSMDELIARLPPAGLEWRWRSDLNDGVEDPASLEMERRIATEQLTDDQWRSVLLERGTLRFRKRWPRDRDYAISLTVPRWLGVTQIRVHPRFERGVDVKVGDLVSGFCGTHALWKEHDARKGRSVGPLPAGTTKVVFDVEIERGGSWRDGLHGDASGHPAPGMLWKGTITQPIELVDSWEQALPPASGGALDEAVRKGIGAVVREWGPERRTLPIVLIDPDCSLHPSLATTGLDIRVELVKDGEVLAETRLLASNTDVLSLMSSLSPAPLRFYDSAALQVEGDIDDTRGWVLRLTGEPKDVQPLWDATQYWSGTFTIPWSEAVANETKRAGRDGRFPG
jgi:hypothetical protein